MAFDLSAIKDAYIKVGNTSVAKGKATDAQLKAAALANPGILAPGWQVSGGSIVRTPAPTAPPAVPTAPPANQPVGTVPAGTPAPVANNGGVGTVPAGTPAPVGSGGGYLKVRQKDGAGWKVVLIHRSKLTAEQIKLAMNNGLNGTPAGQKPTTDGGGSSTNPGTDAGGGATPGGGTGVVSAQPSVTAPVATGPVASWIPPRIGLGGLNADPLTGKIDWSKLIGQANEISAVDPTYYSALNANILGAMQAFAPMEGELQGLLAVDPTSGKTAYQRLFEAQMAKFKADSSKTFGTAAARGIGSSGMLNKNLANVSIEDANNKSGIENKYGNTRIADLLRQMTTVGDQQDLNFGTAYSDAVSRAYGGIPQIPKA